jgi:hypothetical protein
MHAHETRLHGAPSDDDIEAAWLELHRCRMERLVGCLSTPAPKPVE